MLTKFTSITTMYMVEAVFASQTFAVATISTLSRLVYDHADVLTQKLNRIRTPAKINKTIRYNSSKDNLDSVSLHYKQNCYK